jgi:hypothetical protein
MKKLLLVIGILIIGVIVFNRSCSPVVKEPYTLRFTELDQEIQDTIFALWKSQQDCIYVVSLNIDMIDFTNNYVSERKPNILIHWSNDLVITNKSEGWKHRFPWSVHKPVIIKGDKIYAPTLLLQLFAINSFESKTEMDTCRFDVYTIKE